MSRKHKMVCATLNYIEHFLILGSIIARYISISVFTSLFGILLGITSSAIRLKICTTTVESKKYWSIIKKKKKKHNKIALLAKSKLSNKEVLISMALIDSIISHDELFLIKNMLKKCIDMKEEIKSLKI